MMWSEMLPELLNMISSKYIVYYEDYLTFARVCKSWHAAAVQLGQDYSNGLPSRLPSLLLAEKEKDGREFRELLLLSNKSIRKIRLPEAYGKVCRSSCGWLITVGRDLTAQLINPLSRETIHLPKVDTLHPDLPRTSEEEIKKLLIVTNNPYSLKLPLVVVLWGCFDKMGVCRPEDNKWTNVDSTFISDITYYNMQVYTIDRYDYDILAYDVHGEDPTRLVCKSSLKKFLYDIGQDLRGKPYIIGFDEGERKRLLVIIRQGMKFGCYTYETYKTERFGLFAYDLDDERWSSVKNLGKKTLFVGDSSTFWIEDTTGVIKSNCIYFTDDFYSFYKQSSNRGGRDMGIYHLSDETIEANFVGESPSFLTPLIWLESM